MVFAKRKGYRVERKVRMLFERAGWKVVRAGASLGEADLICIKNKKCILLQIKSTKKKTFYYYGYKKSELEGFPFYLVVDFGYGKIRMLKPRQKIKIADGKNLKDFIRNFA
jgi:Holliday junction resolvase